MFGSDLRTSPRCTVVIRCRNEEGQIGRLLDGVLQQTVEDPEIVVVDSGSVDGTLEVISRYPAKLISVRPDEFSFGRSLNLGCAAASSDLIVVASAHVYPLYRDWLERLLAPFADPQVALVYGKQRGNERTKYSEHQVFATWFGDGANPAQDHPFCNNANAAVRRAVWRRLPYDETLTGLEDIAWAKRAMALGHRICYEPAAEVVHAHDESAARLFNRYRREAIAMKQIFPDERFDLWDFLRLFFGNVTSDCLHAARERSLARNLLGLLSFRLMQFWGTYRGFARRGPVTSRLRRRFYYPRSRNHATPLPDHSPSRHPIEYAARTRGEDSEKTG